MSREESTMKHLHGPWQRHLQQASSNDLCILVDMKKFSVDSLNLFTYNDTEAEHNHDIILASHTVALRAHPTTSKSKVLPPT